MKIQEWIRELKRPISHFEGYNVDKKNLESQQLQLNHYLNRINQHSYAVGSEINQDNMFKDYIQYQKEVSANNKSLFNIEDISETNLNRKGYFNKKIGIICDEFLYKSLKSSCNLNYISIDDEIRDIDVFMVVSTWKGLDGTWQGITNVGSTIYNRLIEKISVCKSKNIPVIFFSKEDPINFRIFEEIAGEAEFIFTTDKGSIPNYQDKYPHIPVQLLQFPIDPHVHHPINIQPLSNRNVIFAGSWMKKYQERCQDGKLLFNGVVNSPSYFTIVDRNFYLDEDQYHFPALYVPYIVPKVDHDILMKLHKKYPFSLNLNTIKYSETMCANRNFELQAMGSFLFSNYNMFVNNTFPQIQMIFEEVDVERTFNLPSSLLERARAQSIQNMMCHYTNVHFMEEVLNTLNEVIEPIQQPEITIVTTDVERMDAHWQTYPNITVVEHGETINSTYYTYFTEHVYEADYLADLMSAFQYVDADFITKGVTDYDYTDKYNDRGLTLFKQGNSINKGFSIMDTFVDEQPFVLNSTNEEKLLSIIIPVYNNGSHLEHKCLRSILRNPDLNYFEIILVNDGSTDTYTIAQLNRIERLFHFIKVVHLETASGSASRPRNIGLDYATTPYVTYLDPDNEWIGTGINDLLREIRDDNTLDIVVGNMLKVNEENTVTHHYYQHVINKMHTDYITNTVEMLKVTGLKTASIQAMIVKKSLLIDHQIKMVDGAIGQDSLFFLEMMHFAKTAKIIDSTVHVYYAAVSSSVTNRISNRFFDKYLIMETARIQFLKKHKYMDTYMKVRFNFYMKNWYLTRLNKVRDNKERAVTSFLKLYHLYDNFPRPKDNELEAAIKQLEK
ncbi:glycosyltransferase [Mammaliicoccus stepanovicii]|uniref:Putative glycosyltransferase TagX n=1 Tax=Mammaliicoccus stepanovicii TaxID=643214 RepID=A0A239ZRD2_9STAP|nr:glycosyltransferase [Mammaliicoccus stepanovicii]PNZ76936.1 hypothetical protein CD111_05500 [Mammaliicoccus stepanovicii]GGI41335.1 hypothetical protein GCM10010896_12840 [Mammaliicoccus stepanovicii]SNV73353.1 glycosyl transferase family protein [Mammaliicoccus stepanovicii]